MIIKNIVNVILILSVVGFTLLFWVHDFSVDTNEMLQIFVPLVWGVFIALGGSLVKLNDQNGLAESQKTMKKNGQGVAFVLIILTMIFLVLATFYPARSFFAQKITLIDNNWSVISSLYDSLCFSIFVIAGLGSVSIAALVLVWELKTN